MARNYSQYRYAIEEIPCYFGPQNEKEQESQNYYLASLTPKHGIRSPGAYQLPPINLENFKRKRNRYPRRDRCQTNSPISRENSPGNSQEPHGKLLSQDDEEVKRQNLFYPKCVTSDKSYSPERHVRLSKHR